MNLPLIIACITIVLALIVFPLIVSFKAEKKNENNNDSKSDIPKSEWEKIKEYSKKMNKKTRDNKKLKMFKYLTMIFISLLFNQTLLAMDKKPYHHLPDGTFRNPEGSPKRDDNVKFSYKIFNAERKKIKINFPDDHIVPRNEVLKNLFFVLFPPIKSQILLLNLIYENIINNIFITFVNELCRREHGQNENW